MSAQPVHEEPDPQDPQVIVARLPERERDFFLAQYHELAQAAADDITRYRALQRFLHVWSRRARILQRVLADNPNHYDELTRSVEAIRDRNAETIPIEQVIADRDGIPLEKAAAHWRALVDEAAATRT